MTLLKLSLNDKNSHQQLSQHHLTTMKKMTMTVISFMKKEDDEQNEKFIDTRFNELNVVNTLETSKVPNISLPELDPESSEKESSISASLLSNLSRNSKTADRIQYSE
jgi:hypothetical protein